MTLFECRCFVMSSTIYKQVR